MDIRMKLPAESDSLKIQATEYAATVKSCEAVSACVSVTFWGMSDKYSWVPGEFPGYGDALLWDKDFKIKPAYTAVEEVLK